MKLNDLYSGTEGKVFKITAVFNKDNTNDPWVAYINVRTLQEYSCRQEAFLSRFTILPESV